MFRIQFLLWIVALAALNFVVLRYFKALERVGDTSIILVGLMPLLDLFVLSTYLAVTKRYRFSLVKREQSRSQMPLIAAWSGGFLLLGTILCLTAPTPILLLIDYLFSPYQGAMASSGLQPDLQESVVGALLGAVMSGPPILLALVLAYTGSRYRLVMMRRDAKQT